MKILLACGVLLTSLCAHAEDRVAAARKRQTAGLVQTFKAARAVPGPGGALPAGLQGRAGAGGLGRQARPASRW